MAVLLDIHRTIIANGVLYSDEILDRVIEKIGFSLARKKGQDLLSRWHEHGWKGLFYIIIIRYYCTLFSTLLVVFIFITVMESIHTAEQV